MTELETLQAENQELKSKLVMMADMLDEATKRIDQQRTKVPHFVEPALYSLMLDIDRVLSATQPVQKFRDEIRAEVVRECIATVGKMGKHAGFPSRWQYNSISAGDVVKTLQSLLPNKEEV